MRKTMEMEMESQHSFVPLFNDTSISFIHFLRMIGEGTGKGTSKCQSLNNDHKLMGCYRFYL